MSLQERIDEFHRIEEKLKYTLKAAITLEPQKIESIILYLGISETHKLSLDLCKSIAKRHKCKVKLLCDKRIFGETAMDAEMARRESLSKTSGELEAEKISKIEKYIITGEKPLEDKLSEIIEDPLELIVIPATTDPKMENVCLSGKSIEAILEKFRNPVLVVKKNEESESSKILKNILIAFSDVSDLESIISYTLAVAAPGAKIRILSIMDNRFRDSVEMITGAISEESTITKEKIIESVEKQTKKVLSETTPKIAEMGFKVDYLLETGETVHKISETVEKTKAALIVMAHKFESDLEAEVKLVLEEIDRPVLIVSPKRKV